MAETIDPRFTEISIKRLRQRQSYKWTHYPDDVLPAWVAEMDFPLAGPIKRALVDAIELDDCGYSYPRALGLADAFAGFAKRRMGWEVNPEWVFPAIGIFSAVSATLNLVVKPGDTVIITTPAYHPFHTLVRELGCEVTDVPLIDNRLDPEAIDRCFAEGAAALILCSPHNPTGSVPDAEELEAVAASAERHGTWVLADEIHGPLTLPQADHIPFLTVCSEAADRSIVFCSASKTFNIAGLKCSQIITDSEQASQVVRRLPARVTDCGHLGAIASAAAFREGEAWLDDVIKVLGHNRRLLGEHLAERLPAIRYVQPDAGYLAWLDLRDLKLGDNPSAAILRGSRLALSPGLDFGPGGAGFARLNFATSPDLLEQALERLEKLVR
ncbi:MAG TPA: aminotransferase class I/II-fold pyridoxal phosphate-dependent enzyme [Solirubrobacterales bacterium]|nr:aminotransferase class I/II-fold pyridoxal phosphate-dependent enzyme [Solirubrobacterales bacterium]